MRYLGKLVKTIYIPHNRVASEMSINHSSFTVYSEPILHEFIMKI